jgi:membrane-bound serine protease (ClpP class)
VLRETVKNILFFFTAVLFLSLLSNTAYTQPPVTTEKTVYVFELNREIFPAAWRLVKNAMNEADSVNADYVLIKLNTYGGDLASADSIHTRLLRARPTVLIWITQNAASAGALIAISGDSIYMRSSALIGSASVVNQTGEVMADKYQSYMRAMMRSTAEKQGRDPRIAEGMVTPNNYLQDVADSGKVIALTATEAVKHGYCDGLAENEEEILKEVIIGPYKLIEHRTTALDAIISFLLNPFVNSILLLLILGGIYFEFQHPGAAFPILTAIAAAILYFAPLYLDGLAENWEILLFIAGVILIAVEIFFIPGTGVPGIIGVLLIISGLTLALLQNVKFDFTFTSGEDIFVALLRVVIPLGLSFFLFILFSKNIFTSRALKGFVLTDTQQSTVGYLDEPGLLQSLKNKTGITTTVLRPAGQVEVEGERYDAMVDGGMIDKGEKVKVVDISGNILVVRSYA